MPSGLVSAIELTMYLSSLLLLLQLFQLQSSASEPPLSSQLIDQFQGGPTFRLLSRSKLFQRPGAEDKILAAFGDEATKSVSLLYNNYTNLQSSRIFRC